MCDYSLHYVKSRPAEIGEKLTTINFRTGTRQRRCAFFLEQSLLFPRR